MGLLLEKGTWGAIYEEGISANFVYEKHKSIRHEFKPYAEIVGIYPFSFGQVFSGSKKRIFDGIQIETRDLKVCIFNSSIQPLKEIIPMLVSGLGSRWDYVYHKDQPVAHRKMGIHHAFLEEQPTVVQSAKAEPAGAKEQQKAKEPAPKPKAPQEDDTAIYWKDDKK
jgi:hypothetical protein